MNGLVMMAMPFPLCHSFPLRVTKRPVKHFSRGIPGPQLYPVSPISINKNAARELIVTMATREELLKDIRSKSIEEINEDVVSLKEELFMLYTRMYAGNFVQPSELNHVKKKIARLLTVKREKEIKQGIGKRLSRKLDRKWKRDVIARQKLKAAEVKSRYSSN